MSTILYHANCIDGWFSAYLMRLLRIYTDYAGETDKADIRLLAITPSCPNTYPAPQELTGRRVWLVDVSVDGEIRSRWMEGGALAIECIDHHEAAHAHWPAENSPIHVEECTALQIGRQFMRDSAMPGWLMAIDRIDRWDHPTDEDRSLREMLLRIAHLPGQGQEEQALLETAAFIELWDDAEQRTAFLEQGAEILRQKEAVLLAEFAKGRLVTVDETAQNVWALPASWIGVRVFLLDTSHITIDSTEAAHVAFREHPGAQVFINYRRKTFRSKSVSRKTADTIVYSARSRAFPLVGDGSMFNGHSCSAGASVFVGGGVLPFFPF